MPVHTEKAHRQQDASKRHHIQQELGEQIAEVKARHKQEVAAELAAAKKAEDDVAKWKVEEACKDTLRRDAMLKLKVISFLSCRDRLMNTGFFFLATP